MIEKFPDPDKHKTISFIKSAIRIACCGSAATTIIAGSTDLIAAILVISIGLAVAEIVGVVEELV